jgi:hypothetical protein
MLTISAASGHKAFTKQVVGDDMAIRLEIECIKEK